MIKNTIKLQIIPGKANPAPPIGSSLGQHGVNIMKFCKDFNDQTKKYDPTIKLRVLINIYMDKSFTFFIKQPSVSDLIKKSLNLKSGGCAPGKDEPIAQISYSELEKIARVKLIETGAYYLRDAIKIVEGTAKSMGVKVVD